MAQTWRLFQKRVQVDSQANFDRPGPSVQERAAAVGQRGFVGDRLLASGQVAQPLGFGAAGRRLSNWRAEVSSRSLTAPCGRRPVRGRQLARRGRLRAGLDRTERGRLPPRPRPICWATSASGRSPELERSRGPEAAVVFTVSGGRLAVVECLPPHSSHSSSPRRTCRRPDEAFGLLRLEPRRLSHRDPAWLAAPSVWRGSAPASAVRRPRSRAFDPATTRHSVRAGPGDCRRLGPISERITRLEAKLGQGERGLAAGPARADAGSGAAIWPGSVGTEPPARSIS